MKRKLFLLATVLTLAAGAVYCTTTSAQAQNTPATTVPGQVHERHPAIRNAIRALERAKEDLKKADHDFGGHREAALQKCDAAIEELKLALQYDKK